MNEIDGTAATAAYLNQTASTLRYWRHIGVGPVSFKIGRRVAYRRSDVDAWLASQYETTARGDQGIPAPQTAG